MKHRTVTDKSNLLDHHEQLAYLDFHARIFQYLSLNHHITEHRLLTRKRLIAFFFAKIQSQNQKVKF